MGTNETSTIRRFEGCSDDIHSHAIGDTVAWNTMNASGRYDCASAKLFALPTSGLTFLFADEQRD